MNILVRSFAPSALVLLAVAGCSESPTEPGIDLDMLPGSYAAAGPLGAIEFTTTGASGGTTVDWLAGGASLEIALRVDQTTSGHLHMPGAAEDGSDFNASLGGTWSSDGATVRFAHEADTFIRDMVFHVTPTGLDARDTFDGTEIHVVLVRQTVPPVNDAVR